MMTAVVAPLRKGRSRRRENRSTPHRARRPGDLVADLVADLHPAYAALVMATGIVSTGFALTGFTVLSRVMLVVAVIAFALLLVGYGWRLLAWPQRVATDARDPSRGFGFFTLVAAANVVGVRLAKSHAGLPATEILGLAGAALWLILTYAVIGSLVARRGEDGSTLPTGQGADRPVLARSNGSWFLLVVSTQSLAEAAAAIATGRPTLAAALTPIAIALWGVGVIQYLLLAGLLIVGLLEERTTPARLGPSYWIYMGATAIIVLAAGRILTLPADPVLTATRPVVFGLAFLLWAFGTWWMLLLIVFTIRRHVIRRHRWQSAYQPTLWSVAFPLGMYAAASQVYGKLAGIHFMIILAKVGVWVGFAVWIMITAAMVGSTLSARAAPRADGGSPDPPTNPK